jgi:small conductance mechanosensitive channel
MLAVFCVFCLAVSLAAQNSLAKLAGGLMILATHPFKAGDFIEAAGGISGTVQSIGLAYTRVRMPDNKVIMVPNSSIANEIITNFSMEENRRMDINIRVGYNHSIESVKSALRTALETQSGILEEPVPFINVFSYDDNSIQYVIRVWVKTSEFWPIRFRLLEEIKHSLDEQGIDMSYNRLKVDFVEDKKEEIG